MSNVLDYRMSTTAAKLHSSTAFVRSIMGPYGSGKSVACCWDIFMKAQGMIPCRDGVRRSRWVISRGTFPELKTTTIATWLDWFPENLFGKMHRQPPFTHKLKFGTADNPIELEIIFLALDTEADQKKLLSLEVTGVWFNEARETPYGLISAATGRVGRYPSDKDAPEEIAALGATGKKFVQEFMILGDVAEAAKMAKLELKKAKAIANSEHFELACNWMKQRYVLMDTNPPPDEHWYYRMAEEDGWAMDVDGNRCDPCDVLPHNRWEFFRQPSGLSEKAENLENLRGGRNYYLQMLGGKTKEWVNVHVHGKYGYIKQGLPVYGDSWDDERQTKDNIRLIPGTTIYMGVDSSGRHPAAAYLQKTTRGQWQVLREICIQEQVGMGAAAFSRFLRADMSASFPNHKFEVYGDPAGDWKSQNDENTYFDVLRANGIMIKASPGLRNADRLETVQFVLESNIDKDPKLVIDRRCKVLRGGFNGGYRYKKINVSGDENFQEKPDKNRFSDIQDALQYVMCGVGEMHAMKRRSTVERDTSPIQADISFDIF